MSRSPVGIPAEARLELLLDRTARLHRVTAHLATALRATDVADVVVDEGTSALGAQSAALWRVDDASSWLRLLRSKNYSDAAIAAVQALPLARGLPASEVALTGEPVWISSRADYEARYPPAHAKISPTYEAYSIAALPIRLHERTIAVLAFSFTSEHEFDRDERTYLEFLALHCAQGLERARLYESESTARIRAERAQERALFLVRASGILGSSLDYEETLRNVAALAVPNIGDWCGVELVDTSGTSRQVAVAHIDPHKIALAHELRRAYPPDPNAANGVPHILRTGASELYSEITDEMLVASAIDDEHLRIVRQLGLGSAMSVAIRDRGTIVGVFSLVSAQRARYTQEDLLMAEQLAERAGAAIGNAILYQEARTAIRERDEFMLIAGHELRTPLASLSLHHEALMATREETTIAAVRERGRKLKSQSDRLTRLVEDLLDVSRISAGRLTLERTDFDLAELLQEVIDRMAGDFERARSSLAVNTVSVPGSWDRARIDQVITNLLSNAVKYGKGMPVEVRLECVDDVATLSVIDNGIGIAVEDQGRIFKRFERAVSTRKFGGLGLGLWITSQLVEAHGGTIAVESTPGVGATFVVRLPLR